MKVMADNDLFELAEPDRPSVKRSIPIFEEEDDTPELNVELDDTDNDLDYEQDEQESINTELVGKWKTKR